MHLFAAAEKTLLAEKLQHEVGVLGTAVGTLFQISIHWLPLARGPFWRRQKPEIKS